MRHKSHEKGKMSTEAHHLCHRNPSFPLQAIISIGFDYDSMKALLSLVTLLSLSIFNLHTDEISFS